MGMRAELMVRYVIFYCLYELNSNALIGREADPHRKWHEHTTNKGLINLLFCAGNLDKIWTAYGQH